MTTEPIDFKDGPLETWYRDWVGDVEMTYEQAMAFLKFVREQDAAYAALEEKAAEIRDELVAALKGLDAVIHFDLPWGGGMKPREHSGGVRIGAMNAAMQRAAAALQKAETCAAVLDIVRSHDWQRFE